jgi:protein-disulfide isomerase
MRALLVIAAAALLGSASSQAAAPARKPGPTAARDWTRNVVVTPEGGFRMGNPNAPVKLVEYGSLTCPHCADFSNVAKGVIADRVRSGTLSFEFRNFVLNAPDISATLLARCAGPRGFFPLVERLYANQPVWIGKISSMSPADAQAFQGLTDSSKFARYAQIGGLFEMAAQAGVAPARANACLADKASLDRLVAMYKAGDALGVQRTPTFFINGKKTDAHDWAALEPLLKPGG